VDWVSLGPPLDRPNEPKTYDGERFFNDAGMYAIDKSLSQLQPLLLAQLP